MINKFKNLSRKIQYSISILFVLVVVTFGYYIYSVNQSIYSDKAEIYAPLIVLSSSQPALLQKITVNEGERVSTNQIVAQLDGGEFIRAKVDGVVIKINDEVGKMFSPGTPIVTMVNPDDLRLIVHVAENKGLSLIKPGQKVDFTVDAYGSENFQGAVEDVSQSSDQSSVVFSISDKRDEKYFSIKVKYNNYPKLLNGMSAKAWIYK